MSNKEPLYTDRHGNKWYDFENLFEMTATRHVVIQFYQKMVDMRISAERYRELLDKAVDACNKNKLMEVATYLSELQFRTTLQYETDSLIGLIANFFLLEDEKADEYDTKLFDKKRELLNNDRNAFTFFFQKFLIKHNNFNEDSFTSLMLYLTEVEERLKQRQFS